MRHRILLAVGALCAASLCLAAEASAAKRIALVVGNDAQGKGGKSSQAFTYACRPPGVHHGPFTSRGGCLLYEIHYYETSGKKG